MIVGEFLIFGFYIFDIRHRVVFDNNWTHYGYFYDSKNNFFYMLVCFYYLGLRVEGEPLFGHGLILCCSCHLQLILCLFLKRSHWFLFFHYRCPQNQHVEQVCEMVFLVQVMLKDKVF